MGAPILLIHYGNSSYLPYVVKLAKRSNPDKEIILLGDEHNAYLAQLGVTHRPFEPLRHTPELTHFDELYPRIVNPDYPKTKWARFVLQRWFMINTFIHREGIQQFWTFDSDNYILADLEAYENEFSKYDCTSQCSGRCMNGFVSSQSIVQRYVSKISELLSDESYVRHWKEKYNHDPSLFYNEMEAFADFVEQEGVRNYHLAQIRDGATFDDSITYENEMVMFEKTIKGRRVKKLYLNDGDVYCRHLPTNSFVRMNNLNLSWMPKYVFPLIFRYIVSAGAQSSFAAIDLLKAPWSYHVKLFIRNQIPKPIRDQLARGAYWV